MVHVVIHLDANKTIMMADPVSNKGPDYVFACDLAEDPKYKYKWDASQPEMTFYDYIYQVKFPILDSDSNEVQAKQKQNRKKAIEGFIHTCEQINHPQASIIKQRFETAISNVEQQDTLLVPAFYSLINHLQQLQSHNQITGFQLIIRTFGEDLKDIERELALKTKLNWANRACFDQGRYQSVDKRAFTETDKIPESSVFDDLDSVYQHWLKEGKHIPIQDDHRYWDQNGKGYQFAKQFPYERGSEKVLSIFFDDNIELGDKETNIIAPYDVTKKEFIPVSKVLQEANAYVVSPLQAVESSDYFVNCLQQSLLKHTTVQAIAKKTAITPKYTSQSDTIMDTHLKKAKAVPKAQPGQFAEKLK